MPECGAPAIAQTADKAGGRVPLVTEELLPFSLCVLPTRVYTPTQSFLVYTPCRTMTGALVAPSRASVASSSMNGVQTRETVVLIIAAALLVALVVVVAASVWLAARRASDRRASAREAIEMIQTPADAWRCMGTLERMLPAARPVAECADARKVVVQCDIATSHMKPVGTHFASVDPKKDQGESCNEVEEIDITSAELDASKHNDVGDDSTTLSWVEDAATAPLWASLRRDESSKDESDKSKGLFQALAARW